MPELFDVPVFFIIFRETLETAVVISVLLANLQGTFGEGETRDDALYRKLRKQVIHNMLSLLFTNTKHTYHRSSSAAPSDFSSV